MAADAALTARAQRHAALAEPARLAIVERLLVGDAAPDELAVALDVPSNLLAHHVNTLAAAGMVVRRRSDGDGRRRYLSLADHALDGLLRPPRFVAASVLFVCTANSARSQLAAALWRRRSRVPAASAGMRPADRVAPGAVAVAADHGLQLAGRPQGYDAVTSPPGLVVSVCDRAREADVPFDAPRVHWSIRDPVGEGTPEAFAAAYDEIDRRIARLAPQVVAA